MNNTTNKNAIALICFKPNDIYLEFLNKFSNYDVYIIIDDNSVNYTEKYKDCNKYNNLKFIQMSRTICKNYGFINVNGIGIKKLISGWDKALCYFALNSELNLNTNIWFIEDDVFFYSEDTLLKLDMKYPNYDLLANCDFKQATNKNEWLWNYIDIKIPGPYYSGMMCIVRLSRSVLDNIRIYATKFKMLFFLEALIPTLAKSRLFKNSKNIRCMFPDELTTVVYRKDYSYSDIINNIYHIFHPVKDLSKHIEFRNQLTK